MPRHPVRFALLGAAALLAAAATACGSTASSSSSPPQTITLFAAASTAKVMGEEIIEFQARHPGITVQGDYEGTQALLTKLQADPAAADVLVTADAKHMDQALQQQLVANPAGLASNRLAIALPPGNPAHVSKLADLARHGLRLDLADTSVPAGAYAEQALHLAESRGDAPAGFATAVLANVVSRESDVEQVVTKVASGEVDAGIVYVTDVTGNQHVTYVSVPAGDQPPTVYEVAATAKGAHADAARQFVAFLLDGDGQHILRSLGFLGPPASPAPPASKSP